MKILIFGGTGEARELAKQLVGISHHVTTSLAGRTLEPLLPEGFVRTGGYGTVPALRAYLHENGFDYVVDATHPFAEKMSVAIVAAIALTDIPMLRLYRPAWDKPEGAIWIEVGSVNEAGDLLPGDAVILVTAGQGDFDEMRFPQTCKRIVRLIEPPAHTSTGNDKIIIDRPPYTVSGELALMREQGVTHLLTKNSGGAQTRAKIDAAAELGITTIMVQRPVLPPVAREVETVTEAFAIIQGFTA